MAMKVLYNNGTSWISADLANVLALPAADRDKIVSIKVEANNIMVPDFSKPLNKGVPVAMKSGYEPVVIKKGMFSNAAFKNLTSLDLGDGFVAGIEDGALANLPKLASIRWNGALNLDNNGNPQSKYGLGAFVDKKLPEAQRTKVNIPCTVGIDEATGSAVAFSLKDILTKQCLKENVDGLNVQMRTDDRGYIKPVIKEKKESKFIEALKGQHPIISALIGIGVGALAVTGIVAVTALTSGAGAAVILPSLGVSFAELGIGAGIGAVLASLPLIRRFTKVGKYETQKRKIEKQELKAKKREQEYLKNIQKIKENKAKAKEAVKNHFAATGVVGTLKKVTGVYKRQEKKAEKNVKIFRDRALHQDELLNDAVRKAEVFQKDIENLETSAGKSFAFNGTVEEIRKRQKNVSKAERRFGAASPQAQGEREKLHGAVEGVKSKDEGEDILAQVGSTESSMKSQVEALKEHASKTREKAVKEARSSGVDLTR